MTGNTQTASIGTLPDPTGDESAVPAALTRLVWLLWLASLGALAVQLRADAGWELAGLVAVDGLTVVMWVSVTFFSGIVHSYSRRYMAGSETKPEFFGRVFAFTLVVMTLVAADSLALFVAAWLLMGVVMADLIGHVEGWQQARAAASLARRYFFASSGFLVVGLATLWYYTGVATVSGIESAVATAPTAAVVFAAVALSLAAMAQSALVPFHTWLLSSMTAPTPASALMHAGFVNAGGVLLVRFAPVVTVDPGVMLAIVVAGAASAILAKLMKAVQTDIKGQLGCSTVGQMGFMIMQAGLGFFAAAITHLILHGFYKAYQFLSSGGRVAHESPRDAEPAGSTGIGGAATIVVTTAAGGILFVALAGKGAKADSGLLLTLLVVLTVLHATRQTVAQASLPTTVRYGAVPIVALPAIAVYAGVFRAVGRVMSGLPAVGQPAELTVVHGIVAAAFLLAYLAIETGVYRRSHRLYVAFLNASRPAADTLLTTTEEYNEY